MVHIVGFNNSDIITNQAIQCLNENMFEFSSLASLNNNITYKWIFEYGDTLITNSDSTVKHHYTKEGTYNILLYGNYANKCTSIKYFSVDVIPKPIADFIRPLRQLI